MKLSTYCVLLSLLCFTSSLSAQTSLSGIINSYTAVQSIADGDCETNIMVVDATDFQAGDQVVLIQMQGATISESNDNSFGDVTALNSAGLYEINEIINIDGNLIFLKYKLENNYEPIGGKVQLISMPVYDNAEINDELTAQGWDGNTGGVLAFQVDGQLLMNAEINVNGLGFRGGIAQTIEDNNCNWLFEQDDYFYDIDNWRGSAKGEGIASFIAQKEHGRGAQANGGGGGNDHNSGGGGGSNISSGGSGGINDEPTTFGCDGNNPGEGGKSISNFEGRLFLGGGGGAGHENNEVATDGGNGGGIVIMIVNEFIPAGTFIRAMGQNPVDGGGDGAGGGGGGGTILLNVQSIVTTVHFDVQGGDGGLVQNIGDRCHGPGGGGSGGVVFSNLTPNGPFQTLLNGGTAGMSINSTSCPDGNNNAQPGEDGMHLLSTNALIASTTHDEVEANFDFTADNGTVTFNNLSVNANSYQWDFGEGGMDNVENPLYTYNMSGMYPVQLIAIGPCGSDTTALILNIEITNPVSANFDLDDGTGCAPWLVQFTDLSGNDVSTYLWTFEGGDPASSSDMNPQILYSQPGTYDVQLEVSNGQNSDILLIEDLIEIYPAAIADFDYQIDGLEVSFTNNSANADMFQWDFGDGSPFSMEVNPVHTYADPGTYQVDLIATSEFCGMAISETIVIDMIDDVEELNTPQVKLFPNPANQEINLTVDDGVGYKVNLFAADGRSMWSSPLIFNNEINISVASLAPGVYWFRLENGNNNYYLRWIKQ